MLFFGKRHEKKNVSKALVMIGQANLQTAKWTHEKEFECGALVGSRVQWDTTFCMHRQLISD